MNKLNRILFLYLFTMLLLLLSACQSEKTPITKSGIYFDTVISITLYDTSDTDILNHCFTLCEKYENLFSRTVDTSDVAKINAAGGNPVEISTETADLIKTALSYSELSDGAFDITIAPLSDVWDFPNNTGTIPSQDSITATLSKVDYRQVQVNGNFVTLSGDGTAIDLGGIAKGYIADRLKEYLTSVNVNSALINLGGNVLTIGTKPDDTAFTIGVKKPFDDSGNPIAALSIAGQSIVSSGTYERYFEVDGKIYHHILDPSTGYPCDNQLIQVTIISDDSTDGDALSTTCFLLGLEKGLKLIESLDQIEAIFVTNDYELHNSSGIGTTIPIKVN